MNVHCESIDRKLGSDRKVKLKYTFSSLTKVHKSQYYRGGRKNMSEAVWLKLKPIGRPHSFFFLFFFL